MRFKVTKTRQQPHTIRFLPVSISLPGRSPSCHSKTLKDLQCPWPYMAQCHAWNSYGSYGLDRFAHSARKRTICISLLFLLQTLQHVLDLLCKLESILSKSSLTHSKRLREGLNQKCYAVLPDILSPLNYGAAQLYFPHVSKLKKYDHPSTSQLGRQ